MKKIGIVTEYFYPHLGGITEHVYFMSRELLKKGFEVVILTGYKGREAGVTLPPSLRVVHLGESVPFFLNDSFAEVTLGGGLGEKVKSVLEKENFDLLHIHSPFLMVLPILFLKYSRTVTVGTFHTYFDSFGSHFFFRLFRRTIQKYLDKLHGCIAVAPACVEAMSRYFDAEYEIIPNGVDTEWFAHPSGRIEKYEDGAPNVLFLGRLDPRNGLDTLLDAFPRVLEKKPEARLVVVGDGPMRSMYEKQAKDLLGKKIFFEGQINGNRPDYFAASKAFCYPATKASFGITLLEAMAAGTPIVAADNEGFRDVIRDGVNGLLVPQNDPRALAKALVTIIEDPSMAQRLSIEGRRKAEQYSWSHVTDRVLAYYDRVYRRQKGVPFAG